MNYRGAAYVFQVVRQEVNRGHHKEVTMSGSAFTARLLGATAILLLASACGSTTTTPGATSPGNATTPGGVLGVANTSLGPVLADSKGMTVYLLTADTPGHSSCTAQCLKFWPPVSAPAGKLPSLSGVSAPLAVTMATSGTSMLTAGGWPLYTFANDKVPGDVNGQGIANFGGTWYAVSSSGTAVKAPPASAPAATPSAPAPPGPYGGY
jgi:predicted lipoprotein with Yx(FWY)xxD motif